MLAELFTPEQITILTQIIFIDLVLAGDNAIIIALSPARTRSINMICVRIVICSGVMKSVNINF